MKIEFITEDNPRYLLPFFEEFFRHYAGQFEIGRVSCCRSMGRRPRLQLLRELASLYSPIGLLKLSGSIASARIIGCLPKSRQADKFHTIAQLCRAYGVTCDRIGNPNLEEVRSGFIGRQPDIIASVACPYILKEAFLKIPPLGCINIHHGPLPRYRGMMPSFWQLFHGERSVGVTVHYMVPGIDQGGILLQDSLAVRDGESLDSLIQRSKRHGAHCMARVLREIAGSTQTVREPAVSAGSYFTFPTIEEIREFRRRGYRAI